MCMPDDLFFPACGESLQPIFANRLQHEQTGLLSLLLGLLKQAFVDERSNAIQELTRFVALVKGSADCLCRLQGAATDEDRESPEESLLGGIEQVIAPRDRVAQCLLPCWCIP